jgi:hypothetical protein
VRGAPGAARSTAALAIAVASIFAAVVLLVVWLRFGMRREPTFEERVAAMNASEELLLNGTPELRRLGRSLANLALPDHASRGLFAERVTVYDLASYRDSGFAVVAGSSGIGRHACAVSTTPVEAAGADLQLWRVLLDEIDYFESAKFFFVDCDYLYPGQKEWKTLVGMSGLARTRSGRWAGFHGRQDVLWERVSDDAEWLAAWRIREWRTTELHVLETDEKPLLDVLDAAVPDPVARRKARTSIHESLVAQFIFDYQKPPEERTFQLPHKYFRGPAQDRHPGLAVVDLDRDGFDDFYVMERWGKNLFFRNRGDGTFEEIAASLGVDVEDHCSSALFADYDNDGDADLFLGRTLARSMYFENRGGRFVDRSGAVGVELPYLVSSLSAADYDQDGLLDVYFATYASDAMRTDQQALTGPDSYLAIASGASKPVMLREFLSEKDARQLHFLVNTPEHGYHVFRNAYGPPNLLLKNRGAGRFEEAKNAPELRLFRHTYAATWADYDADGDPDLYLANDFAPNNLVRNAGGGRFVDVTEETGTADIGFGMGVTWGDYDGDQRQDLYISNMFSKAGRRVMKKVPDLNPIFVHMAGGNSLFRNEGASFRKVSGMDPSTVQVEYGDWAWGAQFVDLDNDGWLDIYDPAGHYTPPKQVEAQVDI